MTIVKLFFLVLCWPSHRSLISSDIERGKKYYDNATEKRTNNQIKYDMKAALDQGGLSPVS